MSVATLAGGCFWCTEAIFKRLKGVDSVLPGYSGGERQNPSYAQVSTGETGHAEAVQIRFDSNVLSFEKLLEIFFHLHNPTTPNRQGTDEGTQYRSAIFYHNNDQKEVAEKVRDEIDKSKVFHKPIITEIVPFEVFHEAEKEHIDYYERNKNQGYCDFIITPKIHKLLKDYSKEVKDKYKT